MGLFEQLNKEGHTIIMVTHDHEIARRAKEIVVLQDGQIVNKISSGGGEVKC